MSKHYVEQALELVQGQITKRLNAVLGRLPAAARLLKDLASAGERVVKSLEPNKELIEAFHFSVVDVMSELEAIRSGYATNRMDVYMDEQAQSATSDLQKALDLFNERFEKAVQTKSDVEALGALRVLREMLTKALNWQDTSSTTPAVTKDPFQTTPTTEQASAAALADASAAPKADLTPGPGGGGDALPQGSIMAQAAQNTDTQVLRTKAEDDQVVWPRDMAKRGFRGAGKALEAASAAVSKSEEPQAEPWPMDMAPRARRR